VLTSIFAQHLAFIIDPIFVGIALACLSLCANVLGFKIGAAAAIEKHDGNEHSNEKSQPNNQKTKTRLKRPLHVHLYHHFPEQNSHLFFREHPNNKHQSKNVTRHKNNFEK
jgi:hypothetical protein